VEDPRYRHNSPVVRRVTPASPWRSASVHSERTFHYFRWNICPNPNETGYDRLPSQAKGLLIISSPAGIHCRSIHKGRPCCQFQCASPPPCKTFLPWHWPSLVISQPSHLAPGDNSIRVVLPVNCTIKHNCFLGNHSKQASASTCIWMFCLACNRLLR